MIINIYRFFLFKKEVNMPELLPTGLDLWEVLFRKKDNDGLLHTLEVIQKKEIEIISMVMHGGFTHDGAVRLLAKEQEKIHLLFEILQERAENG